MNNYEKIVELYKNLGEDKTLREVFYTNDYPVPYKTLTLYPIQVDLQYYFRLFVQCLLLPHKTSGDPLAISMSYLKYLFYLAIEKNQPEPIMQLGDLLLMVLQKEKTYTDSEGVVHPTIEMQLEKGLLVIEGNVFDGKDFDTIRTIILEQNAIEVPDESINPELLKAYREVEEFKLKQLQFKMCSFEDEINIVVASSPYKREDIMKMTLRSFDKLLTRINMILDYTIKSFQAPWMDEKQQKEIKHYMLNVDKTTKEKCDESLTDLSDLKNKLTG